MVATGSRLMQEAAKNAATNMADEGDSTVMAAAEALAAEIKGLSVEGALEVLLAASLYELGQNGQAAQVQRVKRGLAAANRQKEG